MRQYVAGSSAGMDLWSLWFDLWPILLLLTAVSGAAHLLWLVVAAVMKEQRRWIPIILGSMILSVFAFMAVGSNFPDA